MHSGVSHDIVIHQHVYIFIYLSQPPPPPSKKKKDVPGLELNSKKYSFKWKKDYGLLNKHKCEIWPVCVYNIHVWSIPAWRLCHWPIYQNFPWSPKHRFPKWVGERLSLKILKKNPFPHQNWNPPPQGSGGLWQGVLHYLQPNIIFDIMYILFTKEWRCQFAFPSLTLLWACCKI